MQSVKQARDLVTSREMTIQGFSWQVEQKLNRSSSSVVLADYFRDKANSIQSIADIRSDRRLAEFITRACMLSQKSLSHLSIDVQNELIARLIDFDKIADEEYILSLERRYFLSAGDSLGGTMRNLIGQAAQNKLTETVYARLDTLGHSPVRILSKSRKSQSKTVAIHWENRKILFDRKPKFIDKSVDFIVMSSQAGDIDNLEDPDSYICCGELKGGIDPAGADEHWKTAKSALDRISDAFTRRNLVCPSLIFIGAAIEQAMAEEVFRLLQSGWLKGAANLNREDQFGEVVDIIIE